VASPTTTFLIYRQTRFLTTSGCLVRNGC
jgi:hypothetical protein